MKKLNYLFFFFALMLFFFSVKAQGYDITINFKGAKDNEAYLVKYTWDQQYIAATAQNIKNGVIRFKGETNLDKGVYVLVNQDKAIYFDFFVNESQKFTIEVNHDDIVNTMKAVNSKENELFFSYVRFMSNKNIEFNKMREQGKADDNAIRRLNEDVKIFETSYMEKVKGTFLYDVMNLKTEKEPTYIPKASNGRPDSVYQYYWYKSHYFDGVNFKDERIIRTPFFDDRVKKYFESVILQHPDTVIAEIDKVLAKCDQDNLIYNLLLGYFTYKYEQSKIMGFDKVFVHLADKYIISGKATKVYEKETVAKIKERVDIMRNLLLGAKISDLYVIDPIDAKVVRKWGFDRASTSKSITDLYYKHEKDLQPLWKTLYSVQAKYTILVFWAVDSEKGKTTVQQLAKDLKNIKNEIDFKVFAVQTKDDLYEQWYDFITDEGLGNFVNVYDPIHINNLKEKFDLYSTPVIYLLDRNKKIKAKRIGAEQVVDILKGFENIKEMSRPKEETPVKANNTPAQNNVPLIADVDKNIPESNSNGENTFALIIGNEDYTSYQSDISNEVNVAYAINDAKIFKEYCLKTLGVPEKNITYLANATTGRILQAINKTNKLMQVTNGKAKVIVYYAGHGLPDETTKEPYLIPVDVSGTDVQSGGIKLSYLYSKLTEFPAQQVTVFLDACFSGGGRESGLLAARGVKVKPKDDYLKGNIVVFTASSGEESSLPYNEKQHGMFTYFLLKKLQDTKGEVTYSELSNYLKEKVELESVRTNSKNQSPQTLMSEELRDNWGGLRLK